MRKAMGDFTIVSAKDYAPRASDADYIKSSDVPWIVRFAADGGKVIVSGDVEMRRTPQEKLAIVQASLISIHFDPSWNNWNFFKKSSLLLHYWPAIAKKAKGAKPGFWRIPCAWNDDGEIRDVWPGPKKAAKRPRKASGGALSGDSGKAGVRRKRGGVQGKTDKNRKGPAAEEREPRLNLKFPGED